MEITKSQYTVILDYVLADPVLGALDRHNRELCYDVICPALNAIYEPNFIVWRDCEVSEIVENGFIWKDVDSLTVGQARIWEWMASLKSGTITATKANVRQGLKDAFTNGSAMYNQVISHCKRPVTVLEKLFATGTGTDASPGKAVVEGSLDGMVMAMGVGNEVIWWLGPPE